MISSLKVTVLICECLKVDCIEIDLQAGERATKILQSEERKIRETFPKAHY